MLSLDHLPHTWRTRQAGALAATAVITLSLFSWLALTTSSGTGLAPHDQSVTTWAVDERHPALTVIMQVFTALGSTVGLTILTAICAVLLFMRGHRVRALVLSLTMIGSSLLTVALKEIFRRARPSTDTLLGDPASTTSFPSGHSFNTAGWSLGPAWLCLVTLALLWLKGRRRQSPPLAAMPSDSSSGVEGIEPPPA